MTTLNGWCFCKRCDTAMNSTLTSGLKNGTLIFKCPNCRNRMKHYLPQSENYRRGIRWKMTLNLSWLTYPDVSPFMDRHIKCPDCDSESAKVSAKMYDGGVVFAAGYCPDCQAHGYQKLTPIE